MSDEQQNRNKMVIGVLVLIAIGILVQRSCRADRRHPEWDQERIALLEQVVAAQKKYIARELYEEDEEPRYATHTQLVRLKLIPASVPNSYIEIVPSTEKPGKAWYALIGPLKTAGGWSYFTNHLGGIYTSLQRPHVDDKTCDVPENMVEYKP